MTGTPDAPQHEDAAVSRRTWLAAERTWLAWWRTGAVVLATVTVLMVIT